jgi:hypothetical protein
MESTYQIPDLRYIIEFFKRFDGKKDEENQ